MASTNHPISPVTNVGYFHGSASKDNFRNFFAGSVSGFLCKVLEYPLDTVKVIQQTAKPGLYKGPIDVAVTTVRSHGVFSLYQGLTTPLIGSILENAFVFAAYKKCQHALGMEENVWSPRWMYGVCGMGAGMVSSLVLTPAELIKCKMQVRQSAIRGHQEGDAIILAKSPFRMITKIIREEGIVGMYRGHLACMMRELPGNFAWFGVYEAVLREIAETFEYKSREDVPLMLKSMAGSFAGMCYWAVPYPFDTAKSLLQTDPRFMGQGVLPVLKTIFHEQGVRGLYKGLPVTLVRAAPSHALIFLSFEWVAQSLKVW